MHHCLHRCREKCLCLLFIIISAPSHFLSLHPCLPGRCFAFRGERGNDEPPIEMIKVSHLKWVFLPLTSPNTNIITQTHTQCIYIYPIYTHTHPFPLPAWRFSIFATISISLWISNYTFSQAPRPMEKLPIAVWFLYCYFSTACIISIVGSSGLFLGGPETWPGRTN